MASFFTSTKKAICGVNGFSTADVSLLREIITDHKEMFQTGKSLEHNKTLRDVSVLNSDMIAASISKATEKTWKHHRCTMIHAKNTSESTPSTPRSHTGSKQKLNLRATTLELELLKKCKSYQELEQKHLKQCEQRLRDKDLLDQAFEEIQAMEAMYEIVSNKYETSIALLEKKQHELKKLNTDHRSALTTIRDIYEEKLVEANRNSVKERHVLETRHLEALRALTEVSKTNRSVWEHAQKAMEADAEQMACDYRDVVQDNENEIMRLAKCNHDLEAENNLLIGTLTDRPGDELREHAQNVFQEIQRTKSELEQARTDLRVAHIKMENILEAMQQQRDHYESHGAKEQEAQAQVCDLQQQIVELQEKLAVRDDLLRAADAIPKDSDILGSEHLLEIALKMQKLDDEVKLVRAENAELQSKANKMDDENLEISIKLDMTEYEMCVAQDRLEILEAKQSLLVRERDFLADAVAEDDCLSVEDKDLLRRHLRQVREENEKLRDRNVAVSKQNADLQACIKKVQDKAEVKIQQAEKAAAYWQTLYWDEAVPKTEALCKEVHELNKELGRNNVHVQERLERNVVVADRNALRYACEATLRGVDTNLIPAEYYEPGFTPGWLPATHDALRLLRPLGWAPVADLDKVWLAPMYKPFAEEDAKERLEAQGQIARKQHRKAMGATPPPECHPEAVSGDAAAGPAPVLLPSWVPVCDRTPMARTPYHEPYAPPYQTAWRKKRANLTREAYDDMDNTLKLDVLEMLDIQIECAETLGRPSHIVSYDFEEDPDIF
ncbi:hypothetical protein J3E71DRAFT_176116 [Bipolaris maydis]|nr:hypothetical protein J3E71DRAFT_176116 [Bipolaris maydis]